MSNADRFENFAARVNYAAAFMMAGKRETTRGFCNCFENYDGEVVIAALARRAAKNERLREGLYRLIDPASVESCAKKYSGVRSLAAAAAADRAVGKAQAEARLAAIKAAQ